MMVIIGDTSVETTGCMRYLEILLDSKLLFTDHVNASAAIATIAMLKIERILPNISTATPRKRIFLGSVPQSLSYYKELRFGPND